MENSWLKMSPFSPVPPPSFTSHPTLRPQVPNSVVICDSPLLVSFQMPTSTSFSTAWLWNSSHICLPFPYMSFFRLKFQLLCLHLCIIFLPCLSACPLHLSSALHLQFLTSIEHSRTHSIAPLLRYQDQTPHPDFTLPYNFPPVPAIS